MISRIKGILYCLAHGAVGLAAFTFVFSVCGPLMQQARPLVSVENHLVYLAGLLGGGLSCVLGILMWCKCFLLLVDLFSEDKP